MLVIVCRMDVCNRWKISHMASHTPITAKQVENFSARQQYESLAQLGACSAGCTELKNSGWLLTVSKVISSSGVRPHAG